MLGPAKHRPREHDAGSVSRQGETLLHGAGAILTRRGPLVGIDATPLVTGHRTRGIGRHVGRMFEATLAVAPDWAEADLGTMIAGGQPAPLPGRTWRTRRSRVRPQDLDPLMAPVADRLAIRRHPPGWWHHTDPLDAASPLPARRTVVSVYDAIPLQEIEVWRAIRPHRRLAYRRYLDLARASRGVIVSLASTAIDVETVIGIARDRIAVVSPYVRRLGPPREGEPATPPADSARRFVFVGVLDAHKRAELAVDVIAELARRGEPATLIVVGARPPRRRSALERYAAGLGLMDRVRFIERPDDTALDELYGASTLLATSRVEGFGQPPIEAILAGGRVVAVPIPAYLETVSGLATFAAEATAGALADAALDPLDPPDAMTRAALGQRFGPGIATDALREAYGRFGAI